MGHQVVQLMMKSGKQAYPYDFRLFQKDQTESKIRLSKDLLASIPFYKQPTYLLCDSWYTSRQLIEAALRRGKHVTGVLKKNRTIYPAGVHMQVKQFAAYLDEQDTDLVTIGKNSTGFIVMNALFFKYRYRIDHTNNS